MPVKRPCLARGCVEYAYGSESYCETHRREKNRARERSPSSTVAWTTRWKRVRAVLIRKRRRPDGTWLCEICRRTIATESDIDIDHRIPVSEGGESYAESNLRVAHRQCNRRAGALAQAEARRRRLAESPIGRALAQRKR